jgi:hypothetical protein
MTGPATQSNIVIPGRIEDANYDVQLHIGESRDSGRSPRRATRASCTRRGKAGKRTSSLTNPE